MASYLLSYRPEKQVAHGKKICGFFPRKSQKATHEIIAKDFENKKVCKCEEATTLNNTSY
jgi:hypothetical protein